MDKRLEDILKNIIARNDYEVCDWSSDTVIEVVKEALKQYNKQPNQDLLNAVEFGYKQAEKGHNIDYTLNFYKKLWNSK